jgi:hypothetical protein
VNKDRKALLVLRDRKVTLVLSACLVLLARRVIKGQPASQVATESRDRQVVTVKLVRLDPLEAPALLDRRVSRDQRVLRAFISKP